jgi:hypothetical protein
MDDEERRAYLLESLFLNTVKYEKRQAGSLHAPDREVGRSTNREPALRPVARQCLSLESLRDSGVACSAFICAPM